MMELGLTEKQREALDIGTSGHNLIVTGQCGTGKTTVMRIIIDKLNSMKKTVAVTGTTGMGALQYHGGTTIHHWAGLQDGRYRREVMAQQISENDKFSECRKRILECDVVIIDEIGMLSDKLFQDLEYICRHVRGNNKVTSTIFGGIQVILAGSFKQLPPVPNRMFEDTGDFCFVSDMFKAAFPHRVHLTQVMRQDEPDLINAINELCDGSPSQPTVDLMKDLARPLEPELEPVLLFGTKLDVEIVNHDKMHQLEGELINYKAEDSGNVRKLLTCDAPKILSLKVGCPVILIRNLPGGLCNGQQGLITKLEAEGPTVSFKGKIYKLNREKFQIIPRDRNDMVISQRLQFPLRLAYALTVHRAQGLTIPILVIDCFSFFKPGQLGVAVGRATTKQTLQVVNYNHEAACLKHPQAVYDFYNQDSVKPSENLLCCHHDLSILCPTIQPEGHDDSDETIGYESNTDVNSDDNPALGKSRPRPVFQERPIEFPWNMYTFLKETVSSEQVTPQQLALSKLADEFQDNIRLLPFLKQIYGIIICMYKAESKTMTKPKNWANLYSSVHHFLLSDKFLDLCRWLYGSDNISKECNKLCSRLVLHCLSKVIEEKAATVVGEDEVVTVEEPTDRKVYESKVRYLAGACVAKIKYRINTMVSSKLHSPKYREMVGRMYKQQKLLSTLRITESEIMASTQNPESLSYIDFKQGSSRGLTHVSDAVFDFFLFLHNKISPLLSNIYIHRHIDDLHANVRRLIQCDNELQERWVSLFETENSDNDIFESLLLELFNLVTNHCVKILLADRVKQFKEQIPRTKKQALRASLHGSGKSSATGAKKSSPATGKPMKLNVSRPCGSSKQAIDEEISTSECSSEELSGHHLPLSNVTTRSRRQVNRPARYRSDSSDEELQIRQPKGRGKKSSK